MRYFVSIPVLNHLDGEERAGCFALFVFMVSRDCCATFLTMPRVCLQFVIVVFPDHTHLIFCWVVFFTAIQILTEHFLLNKH